VESSLLRPWVEVVVESLQVVAEAVGDQCEVVEVAGEVVAESHLVERAATAYLPEEVEEAGIQEAYAYHAFRGEEVP
jgi:hypothetical protein